MKLIYIGDHFYTESGTMMSPIYAEDGCRSDWGKVQIALERGDEVHIRQATDAERGHYEAILSRMKRKASSNAPLQPRICREPKPDETNDSRSANTSAGSDS